MLTRREMVLCLGVSPALLKGEVSPLDKITSTWSPRSVHQQSARYRVDAGILFLGMNIFSRAGVGTGSIRLDESSAAQDARTIALWFAAGSAPDRARGLNRLGYIHEVVVEKDANLLESAYFGFMTSSTEESLDQAKAALGASGKDSIPYTAVEGSAAGTNCAYRLYQMLLPGSYNFSKYEDVIRQVKGVLARDEIQPARKESSAAETPRTFLYAVREAMRSPQGNVNAPFLYNGKRYRLEAQKSADAKIGQQLTVHKVTSNASKIMRMNGTIHNVATRAKTPFKLWFEPGREMPLRFEYKAKSYLNLVFEYVPA